MNFKFSTIQGFKCLLLSGIILQTINSVWIAIYYCFCLNSTKQYHNENGAIVILYSVISILFTLMFGITGLYLRSERILATFCIFSILLIPITILVRIESNFYFQIVLIVVNSIVSLVLSLRIHVNRRLNSSPTQVINHNFITSSVLMDNFDDRPPNYEELQHFDKPPNYNELFKINSKDCVLRI
jgi:hypothetical protein